MKALDLPAHDPKKHGNIYYWILRLTEMHRAQIKQPLVEKPPQHLKGKPL